MAVGVITTSEWIQTSAIILYAWDRVCQRRDFNGWQIALYRSIDIVTSVHALTDTDTAGK
jgi:hypothetical protein